MGKREIYVGDTTQGIWLKFARDALWVAGQLNGQEIPHKPIPWSRFDQVRKDSRLDEEPTLYERYKRENQWNSDAADMRSFKMAVEYHFQRDKFRLGGKSLRSRVYETPEEHMVLFMGDEVLWDFGPLNGADDQAYSVAFQRFEESLERIRERVQRGKRPRWWRRLTGGLQAGISLVIVLYSLAPCRYIWAMKPPKAGAPATPAASANSAPKRASDRTRDELKARFLVFFRELHFIKDAAARIGVNRDTVTNWRNSDPAFAAAFDAANEDVTEVYETRLRDLALGIENKQGVLVSDTTALIFALKARAPKKYTERFRHEVSNGQLEGLISEMISLVKRYLPDTCPNCKTNLALRATLAKHLIELSQRLEKPAAKLA